jgi:hypothetical protein
MSVADPVEILAGKAMPSPNGRARAPHFPVETAAPIFTAELDAYRMEWSAPAVTIRLEDLRGDRRSGDVKADVDVEAAGIRILQNVTINLKASTTRAQLARQLSELSKGIADAPFWSAAVNDVCGRTVRAFREGDPPILLRDAAAPAASSWAIPSLVLADQPTFWFGDGAAGKSETGLAAGLDIHCGTSLLGIKSTRRMRVGFADSEFTDWDHKQRMVQLLGPGHELPDLVYIRCERPLRDEAPRLQRIIREHRLEFLIIDSVGFLCEGPPEEAQSAVGFFQALRSLRVGTLCIAHVNRNGDTERPFGSAFWHNGARLTWYVKKVQDLGGAMTVGFFNKKSNTTALSKPIGFRFEFDDDVTRIIRTDVRDVPELAGQVPLKDRMTHALKAGARTFVELADVLEADAESIGRVARRYEGKLFTLLPGLDGKKRVGLADFSSPDTVPDSPDTVRLGKNKGGRTQGGSLEPLSGPLSDEGRGKAPGSHCACGELDWIAVDAGWRCAGCGLVRQ